MMIKEYIAYLKDNPKGYWFKAKLYGWGWTPATWQGWLMLVLYLCAVWGAYECQYMRIGTDNQHEFILYRFVPQVILLTVMFIILCMLKGEKPRWRWGK